MDAEKRELYNRYGEKGLREGGGGGGFEEMFGGMFGGRGGPRKP